MPDRAIRCTRRGCGAVLATVRGASVTLAAGGRVGRVRPGGMLVARCPCCGARRARHLAVEYPRAA